MKLFSAEKYRGKRVCVALSGGVDSVCLLHAFRECAAEYGITLSAAHLEHGIRGEESLRDLDFCKALCAQWNIPIYTVRIPVRMIACGSGRNIEEVAREVRYGFFASIVEENRADVVATAHHMNDVAETILFRLTRGTSLAGMKGITERDGIIRPLLDVSRRELEDYAERYRLPHVEDSTNADENYSRNRIRHSALPALELVNENAVWHIARFAALAAKDDDYLQTLANEKIVRRAGELAVPVKLPDPLFLRACIAAMKEIGALKDYTYEQLSGVLRLRELQSGKRVSLSRGIEAIREYGNIVFYDSTLPADFDPIPFVPDGNNAHHSAIFSILSPTDGTEIPAGALAVDLDCFPENCVVRTRREGDFIVPFGGGTKTLKKFLTDKKIPARLGRKLPLIACGSEVLVVIGVEIADKVKITDKTVRRGCIR